LLGNKAGRAKSQFQVQRRREAMIEETGDFDPIYGWVGGWVGVYSRMYVCMHVNMNVYTYIHVPHHTRSTTPTPKKHRSKGVRDQIYLFLWSLVKRETRYSPDSSLSDADAGTDAGAGGGDGKGGGRAS
jgi:hypothetical protein